MAIEYPRNKRDKPIPISIDFLELKNQKQTKTTMNWTKYLIASFIGGVVYFFSGWGIHGVLLREMTAFSDSVRAVVEIPESEFKISYMIVSCLVAGATVALVLMRWAGVSTFSGGAKIGAMLGVLVTLWVQLSYSSMYRMLDLSQIGIAAIGEAICVGLAGGVIGWYLGRD